jgi:hypothetical protein
LPVGSAAGAHILSILELGMGGSWV